ncbi:MAG: hypothetical protein AB7P01_09605 [Bacteroidia bacterium]
MVFSLVLLLSACGVTKQAGSHNTIIRQAENVPEAFFPPEGIVLDETSCKSPLTDKRDGTKITMASSANSEGTYRVPEGKYGVKKGELLLLDCKTGKVLGIVKE